MNLLGKGGYFLTELNSGPPAHILEEFTNTSLSTNV